MSAAILAVYTVSLWVAITSAFDDVSSFQLSEFANDPGTVKEVIEQAYGELDSIAESTGKARRVATPIFILCSPGWVIPTVRNNCDATRSLFERFDRDRNGAVWLLNTVQLMNGVLVNFRGDATESNPTELAESVEELKFSISQFDQSVAAAGAISPSSDQVLLPLVSSAFAKAERAETDLRTLATFVRKGIRLLDSGVSLEREGRAAFEELTSIGDSSASFDELRSALLQLDPAVHQFQYDLDQFTSAMPDYLEGTSIHDAINSASDDAELIVELILALTVPIEILDESLSKIQGSDDSLLAGGGISVLLDELVSHEQELFVAAQSLLQVNERLENGFDLQRLLGMDVARKLDELLIQYSDLIKVLYQAPTTLRSLLGASESKKYLVLGQSSDELRPAGGFTSSVWVMNFSDGALVDIEYIDVLSFRESFDLAQIPDPPDELFTHMDAGAWYLRDVGWSPNFRSVGELAVLMNSVAGREPIDGVISITPWGFMYLVDGLGSIDTPDGELHPNQVMVAIEHGTDTQGTAYLQTMFDSMTASVTVEKLEDNFVSFSRSILRSFTEKQIMIYAVDHDLQNQLAELGWAGIFTPAQGDVLGVFDSNVGWNKVGRNIERSVEYQLQLRSDGGGNSRLRITQNNKSKGDYSACGIQAEPATGGNLYHLLKDGCYWDLLRVYTPFGVEVISLPELGAPESSVAVRSGRLRAGATTAGVSWDDSGQYFRGLMVVSPGTESTIEFEYELPAETSIVLGDELEYLLNVPIQAGVPTSGISLRIAFPVGYRIIESSIGSTSSDPRIFQADLVLDSDIKLRVLATKAG